jgi:hypothetical protein
MEDMLELRIFLQETVRVFWHLIILLAGSVKFEDSLKLSRTVSEKAFGFGRKHHKTSQCVLQERAK